MKPFKLQSVLDYRKKIEDVAQKALLKCLEEQRLLMFKKIEEQKLLQQLHEHLHETKRKGFLIAEIRLYEDCLACKKKQVQDTIRQLDLLDKTIKEKQKQLIKARQGKKTLEILKENRKTAEEQRQKHMENVFLDEVAMLSFGDKK